MNMKGYIYKYTFKDGKVYIGQTRRPMEVRHREHLNPSTGPVNKGFWSAYQKLGMPKLQILETIESDDVTELVEVLNRLETAYIFENRATNPKYGYNRVHNGMSHSPDVIALRREYERLCALVREKMQPFFDDLFEKISEGRTAEFTEEEQAFVEGYINHNNLFVHSIEEMKDDFSYWYAKDYAVWLYMSERDEDIEEYVSEHAEEIIQKSKEIHTIQQLDEKGNVIKEYHTKDEIRSTFKIARIDNIINVIKGRQKTAYGYKWRLKPLEAETV